MLRFLVEITFRICLHGSLDKRQILGEAKSERWPETRKRIGLDLRYHAKATKRKLTWLVLDGGRGQSRE